MDRGSSSFSQRLRALTSRPEGEPDAAGEARPDAPPPVDGHDEQPTGDAPAVGAGPTPPPPRETAETAAPPAGGDTELPPVTAPPMAEDVPPGDDQDTIEWRAIRMPADGPTLEPPKLQKPSKTPRPATPDPAPTFAKPQAVADVAPAAAPATTPAPHAAAAEEPVGAAEPAAPEDAPVAPPALAQDQPTATFPTAPVSPPIPPADEEAPGGLRSLWRKSRGRGGRDPDIVSFDSGEQVGATSPNQPPPAASAPAPADQPAPASDEARNLSAALRRFKPTKRSADEHETSPPAAPESAPAPVDEQPATKPALEPIPEKPSFAERASLRRRAKSLRARRDAGLLELGAIVLDQRRFGDASGGTLTRKRTDELTDLDNELAEIEIALREDRPMTAVEAVGVARCANCSSLLGPRDRFCAECGTPRDTASGPPPATA